MSLPRTFAASVSLLSLAAACDKSAEPSAEASAKASAGPTPSASASAKPKPWFAGTWKGSYDASHFPIEMEKKHGAVAAWKSDDGGVAVGKGEVTILIDDDGQVSGSSKGPLGDLEATGQLDEDLLSVRFMPESEQAMASAFLRAEKKGEELSGDIRASSGDSLVVRQAKISLKKSAAEK